MISLNVVFIVGLTRPCHPKRCVYIGPINIWSIEVFPDIWPIVSLCSTRLSALQEEQNAGPVASMDYGFFTDGRTERMREDQASMGDGQLTKGATPFLSMMIWSMPVQCKGVEDQAALEEKSRVFVQTWNPEWIVRPDTERAMPAFRGAVATELKERFGGRASAHAPRQNDSASAGMVENVIFFPGKGVDLVTTMRELHGVVMGPEHVALAWCVRFAGENNARTVKGAEGLTARASFTSRVRRERESSFCKSTKKKAQLRPLLRRCLLDHWSTVWRRPREDAADPVFQEHSWDTLEFSAGG